MSFFNFFFKKLKNCLEKQKKQTMDMAPQVLNNKKEKLKLILRFYEEYIGQGKICH